MLKHPLLSILLLALLLGVWGCKEETVATPAATSGEQQDDAPLVIWWAQWAPADGLQELGNEYEKETGQAVRVEQIPWTDYQKNVFQEFGNNATAFDIVIGDSQWIGRCATKGLYVDLTDWIGSAVDLAAIHPEAGKYLCEYPTGSGRFFAAPCETDAVGIVYRKDWFEDPKEKQAFQAKYGRELTIPETWEQFHQVAEFFTRPSQNRYGCAILTGQDYDSLTMGFQQFLWANGGAWHDGNYKVQGKLNGPEGVEALRFMKDLLKFTPPGGSNMGYAQTPVAMTNGSVAMTMNYFAFYPGLVKDPQVGGKLGFFANPGGPAGRGVSLGGQGFSISTKVAPERQEKAKKFIAWFLQKPVQEKWITKEAGFTANTEILSSEAFKKAAPYNPTFAESLNHVRDFYNVPEFNELLTVSQTHLAQALNGSAEPQAALDKIAAEHEKILKEAGHLK